MGDENALEIFVRWSHEKSPTMMAANTRPVAIPIMYPIARPEPYWR